MTHHTRTPANGQAEGTPDLPMAPLALAANRVPPAAFRSQRAGRSCKAEPVLRVARDATILHFSYPQIPQISQIPVGLLNTTTRRHDRNRVNRFGSNTNRQDAKASGFPSPLKGEGKGEGEVTVLTTKPSRTPRRRVAADCADTADG